MPLSQPRVVTGSWRQVRKGAYPNIDRLLEVDALFEAQCKEWNAMQRAQEDTPVLAPQ